jgi:cyclomaltodextrinase / maltogenic alpha-amylase / neopullulanase
MSTLKHFALWPLLALLVFTCTEKKPLSPQSDPAHIAYVPEWARNVVWYQIFVERFRNGDPSNDPTLADIQNTFPENIPANWHISDWGADWYVEEGYMAGIIDLDFYGKIQLRRYGGDLQGVLDKIDYIADLGVTAIYFNPLNDSPSLHKYDPRHWRHIDRNFGPDPVGDAAIMASEVPDDPSTWQWTAADRMFLDVIKAFHARGIRVILDYSWNHVGYDFWAVNDLREKGTASKYKDWFEIKTFDDPATPENETEIAGWWGFKFMPVVKENVENPDDDVPHEGNMASETMKQHIFNVSRRWLDPNGDGNFDDGVGGYRLDVAAEVTLGFWREYRQFVKSVNPDAYLVGEVWWLNWPDEMLGPGKMLQGDIFDAVMNYRWYLLARGFFSQGEPKRTPSELVAGLKQIAENIPIENQQALMNITASHDTPRLSTCFFNDGKYKYLCKLSEDPGYKVHRPDAHTWQEVRMMLLHQFSFIGSPHIWNGDEMGMWGADDPDCRKPLWWDDITFQPEAANPYVQRTLPPDDIRADQALTDYYKKVIKARVDNPVLAFGDIDYLLADDAAMTLAYARRWKSDEALALFNRSGTQQTVTVPARKKTYRNAITGETVKAQNGTVSVMLESVTGVLLIGE